MKTLKLTAAPGDEGLRLDVFAASAASTLTRSAAARLAEEGRITVNGRSAKKNYRLGAGDVVLVTFPDPEPSIALPEDIALDVVYEDDDIIVINKPAGMVVHPAAGNPGGTLVNALLAHCGPSLSGVGGVLRPGIVHRLDKDTGGLMVAAKNDDAHRSLSAQLKQHKVSRIYHAIATGLFNSDRGTIDAPIGRDPKNRKRMAIIYDPAKKTRNAITHWRVLERYPGFTYLCCELETGRTHQVRVHMSGVGHPLLGDLLYGGGRTGFERENSQYIRGQCLFAKELQLTHPRTGEQMTFTAGLPGNFVALLDKLRKRTAADTTQ
ncbi:MAG TPA: RluA family pseudouridine synthase [Clostridiales bacterium]|jgi:23S rRNA pseudouridine1911/1915/1917 synthase|nr:RluA family pseudouridine synthase [Clostridiales bacterium]